MARILVVINEFDAPPGLAGERIVARGWSFDGVNPHGFGRLPTAHTDYGGLVVLGGGQDAWDDAGFPAFKDILRLIRTFDDARKPVLGLCLGGQLLARAFGGSVRRMAGGFERGLIEARSVASPPSIVPPAGASFRTMSWHQDAFTLPPGAVPLLTGDHCASQGFRAGHLCFGFQCHLEATPDIVRVWIRNAKRDMADLESEMARHFPEAMASGTAIIDAWLDLVK